MIFLFNSVLKLHLYYSLFVSFFYKIFEGLTTLVLTYYSHIQRIRKESFFDSFTIILLLFERYIKVIF